MPRWSSRGHGPEGEKKSSSANFTLFINTITFPSEIHMENKLLDHQIQPDKYISMALTDYLS
jgi:hypothetical protein